jgi:hypothetical protein
MPPEGVYEQISDKKLGVTKISSKMKKAALIKLQKFYCP